MEMDLLFNEIMSLLYEDEKTQEWLLEKVKGIMKRDGDTVFSELLKVFTHLDADPDEAEKIWDEVIVHRKKMSETLNRPVALRVAMLDYFISINRQIKNPKIIEIEIFEELEKSIITDSLTGIYNKRFLTETLYREVQRAKRYRSELSVMFVDIDDFKKCNELKGHPFGDSVLKRVAEIIKTELRDVDYPCRFGGDEFVVILPETGGKKAVIAAERLRRTISEENFLPDGKLYLTASAGIASFGVDGMRPEEILDNADRALRRAKGDGKDRVYIFFREKREFTRISANWEVSYSIVKDDKMETAKLRNVGGGGLLFKNDRPIPISSFLDIGFKPPFKSGKISALAKVVRLEVNEDGTFDVGIYFSDIKPEDRRMIIEYAEQG
jgi:diguanylate cyclase (GGDEF)-like protein